MKILSIDVGIKNLAICIIETSNNNFTIKYWDVINLFQEKLHKCEFNIKNKKVDKICDKTAKFCKNNHFYCKTHAEKTGYYLPSSELKKYKQFKINDLKNIIDTYNISFDPTSNINKTNLLSHIEIFITNKVLEPVSLLKCNEVSLIDIGCAIKDKLDKLSHQINSSIDLVLIENQISPIANRMNCIQGMLSQYFIMKNIINIHFISASNKLKLFIIKKKTTYAERKKDSVDITRKLLYKNDDSDINKNNLIEIFNKHKKNDDLADCFLQAIWYIYEKKLPDDLNFLIQRHDSKT